MPARASAATPRMPHVLLLVIFPLSSRAWGCVVPVPRPDASLCDRGQERALVPLRYAMPFLVWMTP